VHLLPFESRKDTQTIFSYVLRFKPPNSTEQDAPALTYVINNRPEVIIELCRGYEHKESAMPCGTVLREILKHDEVAEIILYDQSREGERVVRLDQIRPEVKQTGSGIFWKSALMHLPPSGLAETTSLYWLVLMMGPGNPYEA